MKKTLSLIFLFLSFSPFASSQNTYYMEYLMQVGAGEEGIKSITKTWHNTTGSRIESEMNIPGFGPKKTVMLMLKSNPEAIYSLDEAKKSYTEIKKQNDVKENEDYKVEIIGQEKIVGYNCTHAKIITKDHTFEVWTTKDIEGYKEIMKNASFQNSAQGIQNALITNEQIVGVMVRIKSSGSKEAFTMELAKFENGNFPQSMFEIPAGYNKGMSFDPAQMQNMSPEERQKMMEELMKQYSKEEKK